MDQLSTGRVHRLNAVTAPPTNVPTFDELLWPTLKALRAMGGSASNDELLAGGGPLGSSQALLRELEYVAPSIGIDPANPPAAPQPPAAPTELEEPAVPAPYDPSPFARERHVWLGLHAAATRSTAKGVYMIGRWWSNGLKDPPVLC